jgi:hypothetical protein
LLADNLGYLYLYMTPTMLIQSGISFTVATATQTADAGVAPATGTGMADDAVAPEIQGAPIEEAQTPGVLRHLQAGKFKGVADVRLRIVFQKQLAELAEQQAKARATEGSETLVANLAAEIKGFSSIPKLWHPWTWIPPLRTFRLP